MGLEPWTPKLLYANPAPYQYDHEALTAEVVFKPYICHLIHIYCTCNCVCKSHLGIKTKRAAKACKGPQGAPRAVNEFVALKNKQSVWTDIGDRCEETMAPMTER